MKSMLDLTAARFYQEFLCKNLTEKYGHLSAEMDKIIHQANSEIQTLQNKIGGMLA